MAFGATRTFRETAHAHDALGVALAACLLVVAACGEDAGDDPQHATGAAGSGASGAGGSGGQPPDPSPPSVELVFPRGVGSTTAASVKVRGRVTDPDGVAMVTVNGAAAELDVAGGWIADVSLEWGTQPIEVTVEDARGYTTAADLGVLERAALLELGAPGMVWTDDAFYLLSGDRIVGIRPDGQRFVLADLVLPVDGLSPIAYDPVSESILVATGGALSAYALGSGAHTVVALSSSGPADASFDDPRGLVVDAVTHRAIIVDNALGQLVAVDLASGVKSVLVPPHLALFDVAKSATLDEEGDRILVIDDLSASPGAQVLSYALADGDRDVVSFSGPDELDLSYGWSIATDGEVAWVATGAALVEVDLKSGAREYLLAPWLGEPHYNELNSVAYWASAHELYVGSNVRDEISRTSPEAIALELFASNGFPAGEPGLHSSFPSGAAVTPAERVYTGAIPAALELRDGTRTLLPTLPPPANLLWHTWNEAEGVLYGLVVQGFESSEVFAIRPDGDAAWTSVGAAGRPIGLIHDPTRARLIVPQDAPSGFSAIDLDSGATTSVYGSWNHLRGALLSPAGDVLYALDTTSPTTSPYVQLLAFAIDPDTGERKELAVIDAQKPKTSETTYDLALDGTQLLVLALGYDVPIVAVDIETGAVSTWNDIPSDAPCARRYLRFLEDDLALYNGTCLADRVTGAQLAVAR